MSETKSYLEQSVTIWRMSCAKGSMCDYKGWKNFLKNNKPLQMEC